MNSRRRLFVPLLTMLLAALALFATGRLVTASSAAPRPDVDSAQLTNLVSGVNEISFQLRAPAPTMAQSEMSAPGMNGTVQAPGAPQLPYYTRLVALPPAATVTIDVASQGATTLPVDQPLAFAPQVAPIVTDEPALNLASVDELGVDQRPDPAIYGADAAYPAVLYTVSEPLYYRDLRFVRIDLFPYAYNPVRSQLDVHAALDVTITFANADLGPQRTLEGSDQIPAALADRFLNPERLAAWRGLPADFTPQATSFPIGVQAFKIEVDADGIYEVDQATLAAAGMDVGAVDPTTFELMHQGQSVAYEFIGNPSDGFDNGEAIRFYGWKFDGTRREDDYVGNNIFWLWAGGTATTVTSISGAGSFPLATSFRESVTAEENLFASTSGTNQWESFDNEPDLWWWFSMVQTNPSDSWDFQIDLDDPDLAASDAATLTVEVFSNRIIEVNGIEQSKNFSVTLNSDPNVGTRSWVGLRDVNITTTVPAGTLLDGSNTVTITSTTNISGATTTERSFLNRITVDYMRRFDAVADTLIFTHPGSHQFAVAEFSTNDVVLWEITTRYAPAVVDNGSVTINGAPGDYTLSFASAAGGDVSFIATTLGQIKTPLAVSAYVAPDLDDGGAGAEWLALTHGNFLTQAQQLASHRASALFGSLDSAVIDIEDVYNQYGYGFAYPQAIQDFLAHALGNWSTPVRYVTLVGDANLNVAESPVVVASWWDPNEPNYVITDLQWVDRFNGLAPTDHTFTTLVGPADDLIPDLAIGRLAVQSAGEAQDVVDKIITYETNHLSEVNYDGWLNKIVFVSDNADTGGDFCDLNMETASHIPDSFEKVHLCLDEMSVVTLQSELSNEVNTGISILNYRGHGAITRWAGEEIISTDNMSFWDNKDLPPVILSLDCLDGEFSRPGLESLAETILGYSDVDGPKGSAAHWSSTGLGYSWEHRVLAAEFYDGLFLHGLTSLGDAIVFAKTNYLLLGYHESEAYTFTLQGDPALQLFRPDLSVSKSTDATGDVLVGRNLDYAVTITNTGLYPAPVVVTDLLPEGMSYVTHTTSLFGSALLDSTPSIALYASDPISDAANIGLPYGATAVLTITVHIESAGSMVNMATAGGGLDIDSSDNTASAAAILARFGVFLPTAQRAP